VVFPDADLPTVANGVIAGVFAARPDLHGSRLIVHESVHDELVRLIIDRAEQIKLGDPKEPETLMGPLANAQQHDKVLSYLKIAQQEAAAVISGGKTDRDLGRFFTKPTVLTGVTKDHTVVKE
jgi:acyl-CoA reductase-like NAD-dependent aldehyde dehydrogenase